MPKLKNKSAAKKRFRFTGTGKIRANCRRASGTTCASGRKR